MKRLIFAVAAKRDIDEIVAHVAQDNPVAAAKLFQIIDSAAQRLRTFPSLGRPGRMPGTRELSLAGTSYLIVYDVGDEVVTILAIFHTSRDLAQELRRRLLPD